MSKGASALLVILVGVGAFIGFRLLAPASPTGAEQAGDALAVTGLAQQISTLESAVHDLRDLVERTVALSAASSAASAGAPPAPEPQVLGATATDARLGALAAQLAGLETAIAALGEQAALEQSELKATIADALVAAGPRSEPLPDTLPESPPDIARFDALRGLKFDEISRPHLLWTYERVGQEYGRPADVAPSPNGVGIKYRYELPDGKEFIFWFVDGKVVKAFWD
jgi:hypothetical protein